MNWRNFSWAVMVLLVLALLALLGLWLAGQLHPEVFAAISAAALVIRHCALRRGGRR